MRYLVTVLLAATLAGCAARPQQTLGTLNTTDPRFDTPECREIRLRALQYDDRVGERLAVGVVSGLLLGPFGLPIAAAADARQDEERQAFNREIQLRCVTPAARPAPPPPTR